MLKRLTQQQFGGLDFPLRVLVWSQQRPAAVDAMEIADRELLVELVTAAQRDIDRGEAAMSETHYFCIYAGVGR